MKLGDYTFEQMPKPGWAPPIIKGRVQADPTYGGAVVHTSPGSLADEPYPLDFDGLDGNPKKTRLVDNPFDASLPLNPTEAYAMPISLEPGEFAAISCAVLYLSREADAAGTISVEVWDRVGDLPLQKIGTLGLVDVSDITTDGEEAAVEIASHLAFPLASPGGFLLLNAASLTGNHIHFAMMATGHMTSAARYIPGSGWQPNTDRVGGELWQGGQHCVLAGLAAAYSYPGGPGPLERTFTLDDEGYRRYLCFVAGFETGTELWSPGNEITFRNSVLDLMITGQVGEQGLAESA
jgi:hypothetical protein